MQEEAVKVTQKEEVKVVQKEAVEVVDPCSHVAPASDPCALEAPWPPLT
jgi:hypothetical protein